MSPFSLHSDESQLLDHLAFVRKRRVMIAAVFVGFVSVASFVSLRQPPVYRASTRVLVGPDLSSSLISERSSPLEGYFLERRSFDTQLEVMRSEPVAERGARALGWIEASTDAAGRQNAIAAVKGAVTVVRVGETRIVSLRGAAGTPEAARNLTNAVAEAYIEYSNEQRDAARRHSIAWLTEETTNLREELRASEERLVAYISSEGIDPADQEEAGATMGASDALQSQIATAEVELSQLRQRYRERHPRVLDARSRLTSLKRRASADLDTRADANRKLIQYRILKRDADLDHEMYQILLKKLKEADLTAGVVDTGVRVLEPAKLPRFPIAPNTPRNLAVAAILGLCLAFGLAYAVETFDRTLRSADDVLRGTGLATLAVVNRFEADDATRLLSTQSPGPGSLAGESFRTLRTNVRFSDVDKPRRVVLVTSTGPQEGKSTVLSSLAASLAQSGRRTLVIDTDLRRPGLHRLFKLPSGLGLAQLLAGDAALEETVRATPVESLDVMPAGTAPPNPAELIESARLRNLVAELREAYDYVLLDSPPAGGLIDASLLSSLADGVIFVVEVGRYDLKSVRLALRQLERAGAKLYGAVLNKSPRSGREELYGYYRYGTEVEPADASAARTG